MISTDFVDIIALPLFSSSLELIGKNRYSSP
jgi:hypothetical protein